MAPATLPGNIPLFFTHTSGAPSAISSHFKAQHELHSFFAFLTDVVQQYATQCYLYKERNYCCLFSFALCTYFNVSKWHKKASWEKHTSTSCVFLSKHDKQYLSLLPISRQPETTLGSPDTLIIIFLTLLFSLCNFVPVHLSSNLTNNLIRL